MSDQGAAVPTVEAISEQIREQMRNHGWGVIEAVESVVGPLLTRLAEAEGARDMAFAQVAEDGPRIAALEAERPEWYDAWRRTYDGGHVNICVRLGFCYMAGGGYRVRR